MAKLRTFVGMDMSDYTPPPSEVEYEVEYADERLIVIGDYVDETYYYGNFSFRGGELKGTIRKVFVYSSGEELWRTTGLNLTTKYVATDVLGDVLLRKVFASDDSLIGSDHADRLLGFSGSDRIVGGRGDDSLLGHRGNDTLRGQVGNDSLNGGSGKDTLSGGAGNDRLIGGRNPDVFVFGDHDGRDRILGFRGNDHIEIAAGATSFGDLDVSQVGDEVRIAFADTLIRLLDTDLSSVGPGDFLCA